ncbi:MAG: hypothetical protein CR981_00275, partial [Proteobacteria bacterium]
MSRVRIYELAKEAGISSKALAEKLIADGYDIKGHSSTVDQETAENIRKTMLQKAKTELVEKRIDGSEGGSTVIRRRTTIIRRRPKAEAVQEPVKKAEDERDVCEQEAVAEPVVSRDDADQEKEIKAASEPVPEKDEEKPKTVAPESVQKGETTDDSGEDLSQPPVPEAENKAVADETAVRSKKHEPARKEKKPLRKGVARVVGTIELPKEEPKGEERRPRQKKTHKPIQARPARPQNVSGMHEELPSENKNRGRKKGKRGGPVDEENRERRGKSIRKPKKNVKFTHFDSEYQRGGKR